MGPRRRIFVPARRHKDQGPPTARYALRTRAAGMVVVGLFSLLAVRLWSIQVIHRRRYASAAVALSQRVISESAPRGTIEARGGAPLATDVAVEEVAMSRQSALAHRGALGRLSALLGVRASSLRTELASNQYYAYQAVPLATNPPPAALVEIGEHPRSFAGVKVKTTYERRYPAGNVAAQVIGYVGPINASELKADRRFGYGTDTLVGQSGLEQSYDRQLQGHLGQKTEEVTPAGVAVRTVSVQPPRPGDTLVTHLSARLETQLQSDLANELTALRAGTTSSGAVPAPWAAGVVLNPQDGAVLAMASSPTYNNNDWVPAISQAAYAHLVGELGSPLNNYAVVGAEEPGSTFKLATATAALDDGLISPGFTYHDPGYFTLPTGQVLTDAPGDSGGNFNISSALSYSSDVFFYNLGELFYDQQSRYGPTPIQNTAHAYGLGVPSGIDLPNVDNGQVDSLALRRALHAEAPSVFPPASWYVGDNVELAFGQGETLVTPLEMANAYATFANGGTRYAPEIGAALETPSGKVIRRIAPKVMGHVALPPAVDQALLAGFQGALTSPIGTAYSDFLGFDFAKWNLAGKTGTATITHAGQPVSWFVAFGGPKGQPARYAFCVEIDQAGYGADAAAPVVRQLADYLMAHPLGRLALGSARAAG